MDLRSPNPYWLLENGLLKSYPALAEDQCCDVAVMGAGISGALMAEALTAEGEDVIVIDARDVGTGSTCASTALLQYEIDTHLIELERLHGTDLATVAYRACYDSIPLLEERLATLGIDDCGYQATGSIYLASKRSHAAVLEKEGSARRNIGIPVETWSAADIATRLGTRHPAALYSERGACVDAYRLTHRLLAVARERGARVYDRTRVESVDVGGSGVSLRTDRGPVVKARRLIVACGYETSRLFEMSGLVRLRSSFACASQPALEVPGWWRRCLVWESARPYFYLRSGPEGRAIMGGEDIAFRNPAARDRLVATKAAKLEKRFEELFPGTGMEAEFRWAGTFGETRDGLAFIGAHRDHPLCYFTLGFGGNGILYSVIATEILRSLLRGKEHPWAAAFRFDRQRE